MTVTEVQRMKYDWVQVRKKIEAVAPEWLVIPDIEYTRVQSIRHGDNKVMLGLEVETRQTRYDDTGKRWCEAHLKLKEN